MKNTSSGTDKVSLSHHVKSWEWKGHTIDLYRSFSSSLFVEIKHKMFYLPFVITCWLKPFTTWHDMGITSHNTVLFSILFITLHPIPMSASKRNVQATTKWAAHREPLGFGQTSDMKTIILYWKESRNTTLKMKVIHISMVATFKNQLHNHRKRQKSLPHFPQCLTARVRTLQPARGTDVIHKPPNGKKNIHLGSW